VNIGDQEKLAESFPRVHDADIAARSPSFNALPQWSCEPRVERPPARGSDGKMKMLHNLRVRTKLFVAYGLFILPVTFLFSVIIGKSSGDIDFARNARPPRLAVSTRSMKPSNGVLPAPACAPAGSIGIAARPGLIQVTISSNSMCPSPLTAIAMIAWWCISRKCGRACGSSGNVFKTCLMALINPIIN